MWCFYSTDHNKVASTENLSEKHKNATDPLMMLDYQVKGKKVASIRTSGQMHRLLMS